MLHHQSLLEQASKLRRDAYFLETLYRFPSVELYVAGLPETIDKGTRTTASLDRLTLVGIEGNQKRVIPLPVLMRHLELEGYRGAYRLLCYFQETSLLRVARLGDRLSPANEFRPFSMHKFSYTDETLDLEIVIKE